MAAEEVVAPGPEVVPSLVVLVVAGPVLTVLPTPAVLPVLAVLPELTEPVERVDGLTVVDREVISSEELSEEPPFDPLCSLLSLGPPT